MIDNITLRCLNQKAIGHLNEDFFQERKGLFEEVRGQIGSFKLFNPDNRTKASLRITSTKRKYGYSIKIIGSLRKWFYGHLSLEDFTKEDYEACVEQLLSILEIPYKYCNEIFIARIEIGVNAHIAVTCQEALLHISGFRNSCYQPIIYGSGKTYRSKSMSAKMYDKITEINRKFKRNLIKDEDEKKFLADNPINNILRIEFTIKQGKARIKERLGFCTVQESIKQFNKFYAFFLEELKHIQFNNGQMLVFTGKSVKEFTSFLQICGIRALTFEYVLEIIKPLKYSRQIKNKILQLMKRTKHQENEYSQIKFRKNVIDAIILLLKKSSPNKTQKSDYCNI